MFAIWSDYQQKHNSTLLKEMDISIRYNWSDKKDWEYKELFDESVVEKKGMV